MTARSVEIRRARPDDATAMQACVHAAYAHYVERLGKPPGPMLDDYARVAREQLAFVACDGSHRACGVLVLVESVSGMLLDNVAVSPERQGEGLGARLMRHAELCTAQRGWPHLDLYTHALMVENIALYTRMGYALLRRVTEKGYDRVYMRKPLETV